MSVSGKITATTVSKHLIQLKRKGLSRFSFVGFYSVHLGFYTDKLILSKALPTTKD